MVGVKKLLEWAIYLVVELYPFGVSYSTHFVLPLGLTLILIWLLASGVYHVSTAQTSFLDRVFIPMNLAWLLPLLLTGVLFFGSYMIAPWVTRRTGFRFQGVQSLIILANLTWHGFLVLTQDKRRIMALVYGTLHYLIMPGVFVLSGMAILGEGL